MGVRKSISFQPIVLKNILSHGGSFLYVRDSLDGFFGTSQSGPKASFGLHHKWQVRGAGDGLLTGQSSVEKIALRNKY